MAQPVELKEQIDELALRMVMADTEGPAAALSCLSALAGIRDTAARGKASAVAAIAADLLTALPTAAQPGSVLGEGIAALQRAIEQAAAPAPAVVHTSPAHDPELMNDFILESGEHLANIEGQVLTLERDPCDSEALNAAFRGFHTIKGLAGFLELWEVQKLAHEVEAVLDRARNGELVLDSKAIDVILAGADHLRQWMGHLQAKLQSKPSQQPATPEKLLVDIGQLLVSDAAAVEVVPEAPTQTAIEIASPTVESAAPEVRGTPPEARPDTAPSSMRRSEGPSVKVDTAKLDYLVDMAGEMVIAESLVRHDSELSAIKNPLLLRKIGHLTRITAELQKTAMAMRLVPIGPLFRRMARLVRDLSRQFDKKVEMETQGDDIELDRNIVEELADPLMHMVRNSMDHGIEMPADREAVGKPATARLLLRAIHQAGQVVIEVSDNGRGLDREKILAKAISKGIVKASDTLTDNEVFNLIFEPGFSTAAQVTSVSGRGVGMDVVRRHIEKLRGRIEIRSVLGQGATFLLKLPLTLAIIEGLVVGVGKERYIMPLFAVRELFRPNAETVWTVQGRAEMALVRGSLLPVLRLYRVFGVEPRAEEPTSGVLIVAEVEGRRFCVLVDEVIGKQEVVIKTLGETFKNAPGVAGGAILGDGRVGLILDLDRLYKERTSGAEA
ncbi:MAG TPA: chemotaxis protein CheA [Candidatus Acidoferrum sp.]|nr:chemotaxis protein CheA [Candidatus Acidoferrum sp.]